MGELLPNIIDIFATYNIEHVKASGNSVYYKCPFCDDKKGHLNAVPSTSQWRCSRCGAAGGPISFIEQYKGLPRDEAKNIYRHFDNESNGHSRAIADIIEMCKKSDSMLVKRTSVSNLDTTYRAFMDMISLSDKHKEKLIKRGLNESEIDRLGYRSVPDKSECVRIAAELLKNGCTLEGVPGFYKTYGNTWTVNGEVKGMLIPFINVCNKMSALQIRTDTEDKSRLRYVAFSSSRQEFGAKAKFQAHFSGPDNKTVYLTEGALKADIAQALIKRIYGVDTSFLAIPGVNNQKALENSLNYLIKRHKIKEVVDVFDMDKNDIEKIEVNENVKKAVGKIKRLCTEKLGLKWRVMTWPEGKGIDDYLCLKLNKN